VSVPEQANPTIGPAQRLRGDARERVSPLARRLDVAGWSAYAWGAIGAAAAFVAVSCWWLAEDRSIPIYDVGSHLETAFEYHRMLAAGHLLEPFTQPNVYPTLAHLVGSLSMFVGGVNVTAPTVGENLVFVPLLALGCYQTGRLLFNSLAGLLAAVVVLGSPLVISMFHVFMLDDPLAAMVAVSVWLLLASEDFSRPGYAGLAGLAVGLGLNVKATFALFVVGLVLVMLARGGWRNRRGLAIFLAVAAVVGLPWYVEHISELGSMLELASAGGGTPPGNIPARYSGENLLWYFWSILNSQLLAPLFVLAAGGIVWTLVSVVRGGERRGPRLEFLAGGFVAWFVITFVTIHHDIRYGLPLIGLLAVVATGWITELPRSGRAVAIAVLVIGVAVNTLGIDFGVGGEAKVALASPLPTTEQAPDRIVLSTTTGFLASAPSRDGDVPGLLGTLHREGVRSLSWGYEQSQGADFSYLGVKALVLLAGLAPALTERPEFSHSPEVATLIHEPVSTRAPTPCVRLSDGTGVWVVRFDASAGKLALFCPSRTPSYYDLGIKG
jgi:hypothetical protein